MIKVPKDNAMGKFGEFSWVWMATGLLFIVSVIVAPGTVGATSFLSMLPFAAILAIVAIGQTIVIQQRGLDMSAGSLMTLAGSLVAYLGFATNSPSLAVVLTILVSMLLGTVNGLLIATLNITPIVATLATGAIILGAVQTVSGGTQVAGPAALAEFSKQRFFGVSSMLILSLAFIAGVALIISRTGIGRRFVAVGANPRAAAAAGISVVSYQILTYIGAALCFAVAGILYAGFIGNASATAGDNYLLPGIAAVIVGGTSFSGGRGSVVATGVAALFLVQLGQLVLALGASTATQLLVQAAALVLATLVHHLPAILRRGGARRTLMLLGRPPRKPRRHWT